MVAAFCAVASKRNLHPSKSPKKRCGQYIGWGSAAGVAVLENYFSPAHRLLILRLIVLLRYVLLCFLNSTSYTRVQNSAVTLTEIHDLNGNKLSWISTGVAQKKSQVVPSWFSWVVEELRHTQWELCEKQVFIVVMKLLMVSSHKIIWTHQHLQNVDLADFPLQA